MKVLEVSFLEFGVSSTRGSLRENIRMLFSQLIVLCVTRIFLYSIYRNGFGAESTICVPRVASWRRSSRGIFSVYWGVQSTKLSSEATSLKCGGSFHCSPVPGDPVMRARRPSIVIFGAPRRTLAAINSMLQCAGTACLPFCLRRGASEQRKYNCNSRQSKRAGE